MPYTPRPLTRAADVTNFVVVRPLRASFTEPSRALAFQSFMLTSLRRTTVKKIRVLEERLAVSTVQRLVSAGVIRVRLSLPRFAPPKSALTPGFKLWRSYPRRLSHITPRTQEWLGFLCLLNLILLQEGNPGAIVSQSSQQIFQQP